MKRLRAVRLFLLIVWTKTDYGRTTISEAWRTASGIWITK